MSDNVHHPAHYVGALAPGYEPIDFTRRMGFLDGNAFKYVARHTEKGKPREDLEKALFYLRECEREKPRRQPRDIREVRKLIPALEGLPGPRIRALTAIYSRRYDSAITYVQALLDAPDDYDSCAVGTLADDHDTEYTPTHAEMLDAWTAYTSRGQGIAGRDAALGEYLRFMHRTRQESAL